MPESSDAYTAEHGGKRTRAEVWAQIGTDKARPGGSPSVLVRDSLLTQLSFELFSLEQVSGMIGF